ncbi:hypothetical protein V5H08_17865 [Vibrio cholerae]|uniref:hypothetical protein n=1 Tax=Vibrio cholerae TaxID=666 RepID=UPI0039679205
MEDKDRRFFTGIKAQEYLNTVLANSTSKDLASSLTKFLDYLVETKIVCGFELNRHKIIPYLRGEQNKPSYKPSLGFAFVTVDEFFPIKTRKHFCIFKHNQIDFLDDFEGNFRTLTAKDIESLSTEQFLGQFMFAANIRARILNV